MNPLKFWLIVDLILLSLLVGFFIYSYRYVENNGCVVAHMEGCK